MSADKRGQTPFVCKTLRALKRKWGLTPFSTGEKLIFCEFRNSQYLESKKSEARRYLASDFLVTEGHKVGAFILLDGQFE